MRNLLGPASSAMGKILAEQIHSVFNRKDVDNIRKHADAVRSHGAVYNNDEMSSKQKRDLFDWAKEAASIDSDQNEELGAAWQAALDDIIKNGDNCLVDVVKQLYPSDVILMNSMLQSPLEDFEAGGRLKSLGLAQNNLLGPDKLPAIKRHFLVLLSSMLAGYIYAIPLRDIPKSFLHSNENLSIGMIREAMNTVVTAMPFLFGMFLMAAMPKSIRRRWFDLSVYTSYHLTSKGREAASKINRYIRR